MTKNIKPMYYQKFLPGDIIQLPFSDKDSLSSFGVIIKCRGTFGNFYYDYCCNRGSTVYVGTLLDNFTIENTRLVYRLFNEKSDIFCRKVCKYQDNCDLCNFKLNNYSPSGFFFLSDRVNIPKVNDKGFIKSIELKLDSVKDELKYSYNDLYYLDRCIKLITENINVNDLEYSIIMDHSEELLTRIEKIRLYQRRSYTLDPEKSKNYCDQCIIKNCEDCNIIFYNINKKYNQL